jgi:hypothetical protein
MISVNRLRQVASAAKSYASSDSNGCTFRTSKLQAMTVIRHRSAGALELIAAADIHAGRILKKIEKFSSVDKE